MERPLTMQKYIKFPIWYPLFLLLTSIIMLNAGERVISSDESFCTSLQKVLPFQNGMVAFNQRDEILIINFQGKVIKKTGGYGTGKESFANLVNISTFRDLNIYAVDMDREKILNFDYNLNFIGSLENNPNWPDLYQFTQPAALQIDQTGEWFIIDRADPKLIKIDLRGKPQWAYYYPLGGEQRYWQDIRILEINPDDRRLYLFDHFYKSIFVLDYWGNLVKLRENVGEVTSIFLWKGSAWFLAEGKAFCIGESENAKRLAALLMQIPGQIKSITSGKTANQLIILSDKILVMLDE